jgi:hypothetical protein
MVNGKLLMVNKKDNSVRRGSSHLPFTIDNLPFIIALYAR